MAGVVDPRRRHEISICRPETKPNPETQRSWKNFWQGLSSLYGSQPYLGTQARCQRVRGARRLPRQRQADFRTLVIGVTFLRAAGRRRVTVDTFRFIPGEASAIITSTVKGSA